MPAFDVGEIDRHVTFKSSHEPFSGPARSGGGDSSVNPDFAIGVGQIQSMGNGVHGSAQTQSQVFFYIISSLYDGIPAARGDWCYDNHNIPWKPIAPPIHALWQDTRIVE